MQKRKTSDLGQSVTSERGKAPATAKAGQKSYSKKSGKVSSQSRKKGGRAGGGKKQQSDRQGTAYKIAELLPEDTLKKLKEMKR